MVPYDNEPMKNLSSSRANLKALLIDLLSPNHDMPFFQISIQEKKCMWRFLKKLITIATCIVYKSEVNRVIKRVAFAANSTKPIKNVKKMCKQHVKKMSKFVERRVHHCKTRLVAELLQLMNDSWHFIVEWDF